MTLDFLIAQELAELTVLLIELDPKIKKTFYFIISDEEFMDEILP